MTYNDIQNDKLIAIPGTTFEYDSRLERQIEELADRVHEMRQVGKLGEDSLQHIRKYFRIKNIYHSNAIEGNSLSVGETRQVVEQGLTIAGKPLKDQAEATNLGHALDFLEDLASKSDLPITTHNVRQIHTLILKGTDDANAGHFREVNVAISGSDYSPPSPDDLGPQFRGFMDWLEPASVDLNCNVVQVARRLGACNELKIEQIAQRFFEDVVARHFQN